MTEVGSSPMADSQDYQPGEPAAEYTRRLELNQRSRDQLQRRHIWIGNARVALFVAIVALCLIIGRTRRPSLYWLLAAVAGFIVLATVHRRVLRGKARCERAIAFYQRGVARLQDRWAGTGDKGEQFRDPDHIYADDLDIFGEGSLFELLCVARSRMGKEKLADWLLRQSNFDTVRERHRAVVELKEKIDFREMLALAGKTAAIQADPAKLKSWAATFPRFDNKKWQILAAVLTAISLAALGFVVNSYVRTGGALWTPFLLTLVINGSVLFAFRHPLDSMFAGLDEAAHNLDSMAELLSAIEQEHFSSPLLQRLQSSFSGNGEPASKCVARLDTLSDLEASRHNMIVQLLNLPLLYSLHVACALQRWRNRYGKQIPQWVEALGEFEALLCLATYAYEHPCDVFPEFTPGEASFTSTGLGHPLMPAAQCVRNDVTLGGSNQILLVSGSNMSGKSTLLRSVGTNIVLAMMGAPVRAASLRVSPLRLGASMRISDSLQKGVSHFYAEIRRIRQVVELSSAGPLIFLFDEILQGTNSHDRRVGAEGILKTLIANGALGLVTTHDLALTSIAEIFPERISNVHFQEKLESGKLSFDYKLRPGVVTTSNGVELMRSVGLDV